jgi:hypothetical protein
MNELNKEVERTKRKDESRPETDQSIIRSLNPTSFDPKQICSNTFPQSATEKASLLYCLSVQKRISGRIVDGSQIRTKVFRPGLGLVRNQIGAFQ